MSSLTAVIWFFFRRVVFFFDAEFAHRLTVNLIRMGGGLSKKALLTVSDSKDLFNKSQNGNESGDLPKVMGMVFSSRVGLAAGFDKDCEILEFLPYLGFGFAEIGTVTRLPQEGNPKPRLFRDISREAIFNRMGFNGMGSQRVSENLKRVRHKLPAHFRVGVNIGKNKNTPPEKTPEDYLEALRPFEGMVDYAVVNVSSPNTPGLRSLQTVETLKPILGSLQNLCAKWQSAPPLLLKLAPELIEDEISPIIVEMEKFGVQGWVLTNTLAGVFTQAKGEIELSGGWSGRVLAEGSRRSLEVARKYTSRTVISVGGIHSPEEALERVKLGADLVQLYTGWVYGGPHFPSRVTRSLFPRNAGFRP
ncbi:MAG: quinone-dependent dihydroorotate dehydrogenase [Bdellovibrio sp.]|nr:quinone-dependent dihydroorotate dehydrogenase [Bdellovibrio sp.]